MASAEPSGFGGLLRQHRLAVGLTQEELAERAGLSRRGVQDLERGLRRTPHPDTVRRLAEALSLHPSERAALLAGTHPVVAVTPAVPSAAAPSPPTSAINTIASTDPLLLEPGTVPADPAVSIAAEGEHKLATVLYCQLGDAALLAQHLGPEELLAFMDHFFQQAEAEVQRFEGTISSFLNDGFIALFGVPLAHEDHARRGVLAALGIQRRLRQPRAPADVRAAGAGLAPRGVLLRMALHTGLVAVGQLGSGSARRPTAVGETTTLAAALQQQVEPGAIVISDATARLVTGYVRLEDLGPVTRPGGMASVAALRVTGVGPRRSPIEDLGARPLSPFVGRDRELRALHELLQQAAGSSEMDARPTLSQFIGRDEALAALQGPLAKVAAGQGQVVGVIGEPGIGKSRLLYEFRRSLRGQRLTYLEGRCLSYGRSIPYLPVLDLVRANCGIQDGDEQASVVEKVRFGLQEVGLEPDAHAPYVLHLLGLSDGAVDLVHLSAEALKLRIHATLQTWSLAGSQQRPIIFAIEDLHWIDRSSEEYLASLVESLAGASILLLCTWRPGYRPPWGGQSFVTQLALRRLNAMESVCVVRSVLGADQIPDALARLVLERAEGNPFFLEELSRAALEHSEVAGGTRVPETIQGVLMARMDRLPELPRRVLQTASVLGRAFPLRLLEAVWHGAEPLEPQLQQLQQLEFLYHTGQEPSFVFKHALTQEVAYGGLLAGRRRALHAAAGRALEGLYAGRLEEVYDQLAHHYAQTEEAPKAVEYLMRSAENAARVYAHVDAAHALEQALEHADRLPAEQRDRRVLEILVRLAHSLYFAGRVPNTVELLLANQELLERVGDAALSGPYHVWLGHAYCYVGDVERARQHVQQALAAGRRCGDDATVGKANYVLSRIGYWSSHYREGVEAGQQAVALLGKTDEVLWLGLSHWAVGTNYAFLGQFDAALEALRCCRAIGEASGDPRLQTYAGWQSGWVLATRGDWEEGLAACQGSLAQARDAFNTAGATGFSGYAYLEHRDVAHAIPQLEQARELYGRLGYRAVQCWFGVWLAEALRLAGQAEAARALAVESVEISREVSSPYGRGLGERLLGRLALDSGELREAEARLTESRDVLRSIEAQFELGQTHLALAELAQRQNDPPAMAAHSEQARRLFAASRAPKYVKRAAEVVAAAGPAPRGSSPPTLGNQIASDESACG
jgi:class 3 adenylate cyclase/tetratricopeptide (TPR) repeat protein/DNA-binding XRE family transcriptional regulator